MREIKTPLLEGTSKTLCIPGSKGKEQLPYRRLPVPGRINSKRNTAGQIIELTKIKDNDKILKSNKGKVTYTKELS